MKAGYIDGMLRRQDAKFLRCKPAMTLDTDKHFLWQLTGEASNGGANNRPTRQNIFMDSDKVDNVARFAPVGSGGWFACRKIGRR